MNELYSLGFLLNRASFSLAKALRTEFEENNIDLPHSQFIVLRCLYYKDAISQQELATLLCKDAAAIKRTVDNLEKKGLIVRTQVSQRQNAVTITEKGKTLLPQAMKFGKIAENHALDSITIEDGNLLKQLLQKIYNNIEEAQ